MKIIIAGAGEVGSHLAKLLSKESQDVTLVDNDENKLSEIDDKLNLMTILGRPTSFSALKSAGVEKADLFIAVTPNEADNLTACSIAHHFGAKRTVARVDNYEYIRKEYDDYFNKLGINNRIYPEYLAAIEILSALNYPWARNRFEIHNGEIVIVGVKIRENAPIVNMKLRDFGSTERFYHISAIKRNNETIIPRGDDSILAGDIIYISTTEDKVDNLVNLCGKTPNTIRDVIIMGGNRIAVQVAQENKNGFYKIKIIEKDQARCEKLADICPDCEIIHGDGRDLEMLLEEGLAETDAFIALSNNSEANILACLSSKEYGAKKTIAEVENIQFVAEADNLNIGNVINKKLIASSRIYQLLLDADVDSAKCMSLADAEIAEIVVHENDRITKSLVKDLNISHDITIAGLVRDGKGIPVTGTTRIQAGDSVVVFYLNGAMRKVEKLFS